MNIKRLLLTGVALLAAGSAGAQGVLGGHVTGNIQLDGQMSHEDTVIGADPVPEALKLNARADILYTNGDFSAGLRFEAYQTPLLGFDPQYKGQGVAHYFVAYKAKRISVTAGNFYEQFGSGMILRAYEDRYLGLDNALLGVNLQLRPVDGVTLKALAGKQRVYWEYGDGLVRGLDAEADLNSLIKSMRESKLQVSLGAGFVSKYEDDESIASSADPGQRLNLPLNVGAGAARLNLSYGHFTLQSEYARKGQDPWAGNDYIYRKGEALLVNMGYSKRGFSASLQAKHIDNMGFKSVRSQTGEMLFINYLPAINKQYTYASLTMFPYVTQVNGENGLQGEVMYRFKKGTLLGGKYGTDITLNASTIYGLDTVQVGGAGTEGYTASWFGLGEHYYTDLSLEVEKKVSKKVTLTAIYSYQEFNPAVEGEEPDLYHNHIVVGDLHWRVNKKHTLHFKAEWMGSDSFYDPAQSHTDRRAGDWIMGFVEWNIGKNWFLSASDQYAYNDGVGNYPSVTVGYTHGTTRLQVGYGKQREGLLCIGGVCRRVPASNGITFGMSTSF
ncbi:MAG: hypothetical protein J6X79_02415 [Bacteroidales bacterium]|nr:hypothetical protein [Bacteroidales bacterium]